MPATTYKSKEILVTENGGDIDITLMISDITENVTVAEFSSACQWRYFPSAYDDDATIEKGFVDLDEGVTTIDLGERPALYDVSRIDLGVLSGAFDETPRKLFAEFLIKQNGQEIKKFTRTRNFESGDVFSITLFFVFDQLGGE